MSTKDRSGTLPVNAYEEEIGPTEIFNFFNSKIIPCHLHYTKRQVLMRIVNRKPLPLLQKRVILHLWYKAAHQKYWAQNPVRFFIVRFEEIQLKLGTNASGSQRIFYPFISRILVRQYCIARNSGV